METLLELIKLLTRQMEMYLQYTLISILLFFIPLNCFSQRLDASKSSVISGKIDNYDEKDIFFYFTNITGEPIRIKKGRFHIELDLFQPRVISLKYGNSSAPWDIYLEPGDSVHMTFDRFDMLNNFGASLQYSGDKKSQNQQLFKLSKLLNKGYYDHAFYIMEEHLFNAQLSDLQQKSDLLIQKWENSESSDLIKLARSIQKYTISYYACRYPIKYKNATARVDFRASPEIHNLTEVRDMKNRDSYLPVFKNYVLALLSYHFDHLRSENDLSQLERFSLSNSLIDSLFVTQRLRESARFHFLYNEMRIAGMNHHVEKFYDEFIKFCFDNNYSRFLKNWYEQTHVIKDNKTPDFSFIDIVGRSHNLSNYDKKVLYIDVWATWCRPCLAERPAFEELMQMYQNNSDVSFIAISLDSNQERWRSMVKNLEMKGVQLHADGAFKSAFARAFQIVGIPRFILLGEGLTVINPNAPRPSDKGLQKILQKLLEQDE